MISSKASHPYCHTVKQQRAGLNGQNPVPSPQGQQLPDTVPPKSENKHSCPPHPARVSNLPPDQPSHKVAPEPKPLKPAIKEIVVRAFNLEESKGLSMIVPIEIRGQPASAVTDTGAQVTIVNSQFFNSLNCSLPSEPIILKGIDPEKSVEGYVVRKAPLIMGRRS